MAECYYPGCVNEASTKEHIPPRSFFPDNKKENLMTIKSCPIHNNEKTKDDIYVLSQVCFSVLSSGEEHDKGSVSEVFTKKVIPQLLHNNKALLSTIMKKRVRVDGGYKFPVDLKRMNSFFDCLSFGVLFKKTNKKIDVNNYRVNHRYVSLSTDNVDEGGSDSHEPMMSYFDKLFLSNDLNSIEFSFGTMKKYSLDIYSVKILGADSLMENDDFTSSITVIHTFFNKFNVISLLTRVGGFDKTPVYAVMNEI
ncbi:MAG: hypothetical protein ACRC2Y_00465 [Aeromonas veronii]